MTDGTEEALFLSVDGGQSTTLAVLWDVGGRVLGAGQGGPSNHLDEPGGRERLAGSLRASILGAFAASHRPVSPLRAACCGMTGGERFVAEALVGIVPIERLQVEYDFVTALAGALAGEPGVILIAGTGSIAFGMDAAGRRVRVGGWGYLLGDEGSGYDLGRQAFAAAARAEDGRGPETALLEAVVAHFGRACLWDVRQAIYAGEITRPEIAGLARVVSACAVGGDVVARRLLARAGEELAEAAAAVLRRLDMSDVPAMVSGVGGVFRAGLALRKPLLARLAALAPLARWQEALYPPIVGGALLALRAAGVNVDAAVREELARAGQAFSDKQMQGGRG
jgi:glucosamine kinase